MHHVIVLIILLDAIQCLGAPKHYFARSNLRWIPISGLAWYLYKCVALCRTVYGTSATEKTLENIHEKKGMSSFFVFFLCCRDMTKAVESKVKPNPSF